jgi:hypothetical protein
MALGCAHGTGLMAEPVRKWLGGRKFLTPVFVGGGGAVPAVNTGWCGLVLSFRRRQRSLAGIALNCPDCREWRGGCLKWVLRKMRN